LPEIVEETPNLDTILCTNLQNLSDMLFEKRPILRALTEMNRTDSEVTSGNQLTLFD
jgi:hypothetical protein